jgi:hypothetical protein
MNLVGLIGSRSAALDCSVTPRLAAGTARKSTTG